MKNPKPLQLAVMQILDTAIGQIDHEQALYGDWSVQGLGVLRIYIRKLGRLHIWNPELRYHRVSMIHSHSWDLRSTIVCGCLVNQRYEEWTPHPDSPTDLVYPRSNQYNRKRIVCGYNTKDTGLEDVVWLLRKPREEYFAGDVYQQQANEVHQTIPDIGCITLMERQLEDLNGEANVYWPIDDTWGNAQPRRATREEVLTTCKAALVRLERELA